MVDRQADVPIEDLPELTWELILEVVNAGHVKKAALDYVADIFSRLRRRAENHLWPQVTDAVMMVMDEIYNVYIIIDGKADIDASTVYLGREAAEGRAGDSGEAFVLFYGRGEPLLAAARRYGRRFPGQQAKIEQLAQVLFVYTRRTPSGVMYDQFIRTALAG